MTNLRGPSAGAAERGGSGVGIGGGGVGALGVGGGCYVEVKSKFDAEFRRFLLDRAKYATFEQFEALLEDLHQLGPRAGDRGERTPFVISYTDPKDNDLLPINNTDNYLRALQNARPLLRLVVQRQGELDDSVVDRTGAPNKSAFFNTFVGVSTPRGATKSSLSISRPSEFRQVSAIIDVDLVPETCRRVRLLKHGSDKPLGFYIRDGTSVRVTPAGLEKVPGIFISRLVPGGLAESTGLLAVNDEVLEVNGIEVAGKSLDQVTDMMVANSSNLIITVKPANQRTLMTPRRGSFSRNSNVSHGSMLSKGSSQSGGGGGASGGEDHDDEDEIRDLTAMHHSGSGSGGTSKKQVLHL